MLGYYAHSSPLTRLDVRWVPYQSVRHWSLMLFFRVLSAQQPGEDKEERQEEKNVDSDSFSFQAAGICRVM